jgi:Zn finger protein HypA/HybF involved in hydrogenase expression
MIKETKCYYVECDNCIETLETSPEGWSYFVDKGQANDEAENHEWYESEGKYYCPQCYKIDDDDNLSLNAERKKTD